MKKSVILGAVVVLATVLAVCAALYWRGPNEGGPLDHDNGVTVILPDSGSARVLLAESPLRNDSETAARIDRVTLVKAHNLELLSPYVFPEPAKAGWFGSTYEVPPTGEPALAKLWAHRRPAVGAEVPPGRYGVDVVVELKTVPHVRASVKGLKVEYSVGTRRFFTYTGSNLIIRGSRTR